jgi:uncharacterized protein YjlB
MRIIPFASRSFVPAGHENPKSSGVLKKVLVEKADLRPGRVQMVNWASLAVGRRFARHYHEDMQEIFVLVRGEAEITVAAETVRLCRGDAVVIEIVIVARPEILGDNYEELVANLRLCAHAGLLVAFAEKKGSL